MRRSTSFSVGLSFLALTAASGCSGDKCPAGDLDCFLQHMVIVEPTDNGAPMGLVSVAAGQISPSTAATCAGTLCDGRCVSPGVDPANCGACGLVCPTGAACAQGACACPSGRVECNHACVDLRTDPANCGVCGTACAAGLFCAGSACAPACASGQTTCGSACVDTQTDPGNCGGCGVTCGSGMTCIAGACQCTSPPYPCGCIDPTSDSQNCGGCGIVCPGDQVCSGGACAPAGGLPPSIDNAPLPIAISEPGELASLDLEFTDPNGCAPAFCTRLCNSVKCSSGFACTRPKRDGVVHGVWRSYLGFLAEPAETTETFTTGVVPISAPGCPEDLIDQMADGAVVPAVAGVEVQIATTVQHPVTSSSGGGGEYCSPSAPTCNCSITACTDGEGQCWYDTSAGRFDCAGCNCYAAANNVVSTCCPH